MVVIVIVTTITISSSVLRIIVHSRCVSTWSCCWYRSYSRANLINTKISGSWLVSLLLLFVSQHLSLAIADNTTTIDIDYEKSNDDSDNNAAFNAADSLSSIR